VQIFGGAGYMRETGINRLHCASKLLEIGAGTSEIRRLIIGGKLMRDQVSTLKCPASTVGDRVQEPTSPAHFGMSLNDPKRLMCPPLR